VFFPKERMPKEQLIKLAEEAFKQINIVYILENTVELGPIFGANGISDVEQAIDELHQGNHAPINQLFKKLDKCLCHADKKNCQFEAALANYSKRYNSLASPAYLSPPELIIHRHQHGLNRLKHILIEIKNFDHLPHFTPTKQAEMKAFQNSRPEIKNKSQFYVLRRILESIGFYKKTKLDATEDSSQVKPDENNLGL